jgi:hypothetical protein
MRRFDVIDAGSVKEATSPRCTWWEVGLAAAFPLSGSS